MLKYQHALFLHRFITTLVYGELAGSLQVIHSRSRLCKVFPLYIFNYQATKKPQNILTKRSKKLRGVFETHSKQELEVSRADD